MRHTIAGGWGGQHSDRDDAKSMEAVGVCLDGQATAEDALCHMAAQ